MSKTGHTKNIAEFETLINFIKTLGDTYQPPRDELKLTNLDAVLANAGESVSQTQSDFATWKDITNQREKAFEEAVKLAARAVNSFAVSGAEKSDVDDAKSFVRKLQGRRTATAKPAPATPAEAVKTYNSSQTSYNNKVENFAQLVSILENNPNHNPNEADLKVNALKTVLEDLRAKNTAVINANVALSNARLSRNTALYQDKTGLVPIALDAKLYLKSVFGASSPQYKQISGLQFKKLTK